MSNGGLMPTDEGEVVSLSVMHIVSKECLAEFDRLMAEGDVEAVVKALEAKLQ